MFNADNGPAFATAWMETYREAQAERLSRITDWVLQRLARIERDRPPETTDEAFIIHRTQADPRNLDLTLDANDRPQGTLGGEARAYNHAANGLGRFCTLRSFLSQWAREHSRAHGPTCLASTTAPVIVCDFTADQTVFPSDVAKWRAAAGTRSDYWRLKAPHYPSGRPEMVAQTAEKLMSWSRGTIN